MMPQGSHLPALELLASRTERTAGKADLGPRVLFVTSRETSDWPDLAAPAGVHCEVTGFDGAFEVIRTNRPKVVVVDARRPDAALILIRQLRKHRTTRSAGVAAEIDARAGGSEAALRRAGANIVGCPAEERISWDRQLQQLLQVPLRREVGCRAWFRVRREGQRRFSGRALNISSHGILAESTQVVTVGTTLEVELTLPGDDTPLQMVSRVVRTDSNAPHGFPCYGLKFLLLSGDAPQRIADFVYSDQRPE